MALSRVLMRNPSKRGFYRAKSLANPKISLIFGFNAQALVLMNKNSMKLIGLTGGIGSGKSTVAGIFEVLSIPVFYADQVAKQLLQTDADLIEQVKATFGSSVYGEGETLNRQALADKVFHDKEALEALNQLVHPAVREAFRNWAARQSRVHPYVIEEAALIFETGGDSYFDAVISVSAPENIRLARIMERDQMSREAIQARMGNQWSQQAKDERADQVISNDGSQLVIPQALAFHHQMN